MLRERRRWRDGQEGEEAVDVVGCIKDEIAIKAQGFGCLVQSPEHRPTVNHVHGVQSEKERNYDSKVAPSAAQCPEQITVFLTVGGHKSPIGQHNVRAQKAVDR